MHTPSAAKTIDRVIDVFPAGQQNQIRNTLSEALKGVVAQNLFKRIDVKGRVAALEILVVTPAIANLIREAKTYPDPRHAAGREEARHADAGRRDHGSA